MATVVLLQIQRPKTQATTRCEEVLFVEAISGRPGSMCGSRVYIFVFADGWSRGFANMALFWLCIGIRGSDVRDSH
jgi:hypothetical protein